MFIPSYYNISDKELILSFLKAYPFASLVSVQDGKPFITHLPFIAEKEEDGLTLYSHLASFNPHAVILEEAGPCTVAFLGPHTYISPSLYDLPFDKLRAQRDSAPTWNYMAVHVSGVPQVYHDETTKRIILEKTISAVGPEYRAQWKNLSPKYLDMLMPQLTAFTIQAENTEACFKLSQDKPASIRENVIAYLSSTDDSNKKAVAAYMQQLLTT